MQVLNPKIIHFNCPACDNSVEALAEVSGKWMSCPSCGREFKPPGPAPKTSASWLIILCMGLVVAGMGLGIPVERLRAERAGKALRPETEAQKSARLQAEAKDILLRECTNAVVGLNRIIRQSIVMHDADPNKWTAEITAEHVNQVGGVERTTLPFSFWVYRSTLDNRDHVLCRVDSLKVLELEREALNRRFSLAPGGDAKH